MDIVNILAAKMSLPPTVYYGACRMLSDPTWARIVLKMNDVGCDEWLLDQVKNNDNWGDVLSLMFFVMLYDYF